MIPDRASRVLIVDDDPEISELVRDILRDKFQITNVTVCVNGKMAAWEIERAVQGARPFHLVISDWNMPAMTGLELLKIVRASPSTTKLPFILLTSRNERDHVIAAAQEGVTAYVTKPLSEETLMKKVREVLALGSIGLG